jgi:hypothetical protein
VSNDSAAYLTHDSKTADHLDAADNTCLKHSPSAFIEEVHLIDEQQCHLCMHRVSFKMARIQILGTQVQFHESSLLSVVRSGQYLCQEAGTPLVDFPPGDGICEYQTCVCCRKILMPKCEHCQRRACDLAKLLGCGADDVCIAEAAEIHSVCVSCQFHNAEVQMCSKTLLPCLGFLLHGMARSWNTRCVMITRTSIETFFDCVIAWTRALLGARYTALRDPPLWLNRPCSLTPVESTRKIASSRMTVFPEPVGAAIT